MHSAARTMFASCLIALCASRAATAQGSAAQTWRGWARCQVDVQGSGYADQQIHTWVLGGGTPTVEGAFRVFPATWSVVGGGKLQRTQGAQTLTAEWATNVAGVSAPIAVWVRPDGRLSLTARHAQARSAKAVAGYQQLVIDNRPQKPSPIASEAFEWTFPTVDGSRLVGTSTPAVTGSVGFMQPAGARGTASCEWNFSPTTTPASPPPVRARAVPSPGAPGADSLAR